MDSFEEHQIQKYYEEKADGKGQHTPTDRREDVPGELRQDLRQEAGAAQGAPRYQVVGGSETAHCCFEASVLDMGRALDGRPVLVCECLDRAEAELVCNALNREVK